MRTVHWMLATAALGPMAVGAVAMGRGETAYAAAPAQARAIAVSVSPSTATPGMLVRITAACNSRSTASASSDLPGLSKVNLTPGLGAMSAVAAIPWNTPTGKFTITVVCGNTDYGSTTLWVIDKNAPSSGPHTGGGGTTAGRSPSKSMGVAVLCAGMAALAGGAVLLIRRRRAA